MAAVVFLVLWGLTVQSFAIAPNDISAKSAVVYDGLTGKEFQGSYADSQHDQDNDGVYIPEDIRA